MMRIQVKLAGLPAQEREGQDGAMFDTNLPLSVELPDGATVRAVAEQLDIRQEEVQTVLVNGEQGDWSSGLHPGDAVALIGGYQGM